MAVPDFQSLMLPILKYVSDGKEHSLRETIEYLAEQFQLSDEERKELLPSGKQPVFENRVGWARTHLKKAGLLESPKRGYFKITSKGMEILKDGPSEINIKYLKQFPEYVNFISGTERKPPDGDSNNTTDQDTDKIARKTPAELIDEGYNQLRKDLAQELLEQVKNSSPDFFETLVVDLLVKMGYGGSFKDAGQAVGKSGDEGIDGIIKEDRLGLDVIYLQAKRWDNTVSSSEIQKFVGALHGKKAKKGVFITTSSFSKQALDFVNKVDTKVILIDGQQLAELMIDYDVGVSRSDIYEIKKIDTDYFIEE